MTVQTIPNGAFQVNSYLLINQEDIILIDPGDDYTLIEKNILEQKGHLIAIINTHGHVDHVASVSYFRDKYKIPFYMHSADQYLLDYHKISCEKYGLKYLGTPDIDIDLKNQSTIDIGTCQLDIISTPGHTPGGIVIKIEHEAFSGDTIFNRSIGRTDFPGGNYEDIENSIRNNIYTLDPKLILYPGHGPATAVGEEKAENPFIKCKM